MAPRDNEVVEMKLTILGAGNLGTTLAIVLGEKGHHLTLWTVEEEVYRSVLKYRENKRYVPGVRIPSKVGITMELEEALEGTDVVVIALPSHVVREVMKKASAHLPKGCMVVDFAKGLEVETELRMSEVIKEELPRGHGIGVVAVSGPSIARELLQKMPTAVEVSSEDMKLAFEAKEILETPYFHLHPNDDIAGVELGGVFKNVFAIGAGICDGLGMGSNTKAAVVTRSIGELAALGTALGARPETFYGLSGLGDLIVTSFSPHSRNRRFGEKLGRGKTTEEARTEIGQVVEGIRATLVAKRVAAEKALSLPIVETLYGVIYEGQSVHEALNKFLRWTNLV